jgi:hypothetical protein
MDRKVEGFRVMYWDRSYQVFYGRGLTLEILGDGTLMFSDKHGKVFRLVESYMECTQGTFSVPWHCDFSWDFYECYVSERIYPKIESPVTRVRIITSQRPVVRVGREVVIRKVRYHDPLDELAMDLGGLVGLGIKKIFEK